MGAVWRYAVDVAVLLFASAGLLVLAGFVGAAVLSRTEFEVKDDWE